jgi:hypothetical protein
MSYTLVEEDRDRTLGVEIKVSNSAGEGWGSTAAGPIGSRVQSPPPAPADDPPPPGDAPAPPQAPVAVASPLDLLRSSLRARLTKLARRMATSDPRAIARRGLARHRLVMPATGFLALRWVARGRTIGAGRADGTDGEPAVVDVKLSRRGRALLRRSKRIAVVVRGSFVGGAATKASPATAEASFTLRRRRA